MTKVENIQRTSGGSVTRKLPETRLRSINYPFSFIHPIEVYVPTSPEPTFTFWHHPNDTTPMGSVVYFIYSAGRIKIGFTEGLIARLDTLRTASPFPPVVLLVVRGTPQTERQFHARFAEDRIHGEWFRLSQKLRNLFRARLCPVGRASLKRCEEEYRVHCKEHL